LQGVIKQAMLNASGHLILPEFLPSQLGPMPEVHAADASTENLDLSVLIDSLLPRASGQLYAQVISAVERVLFVRVLLQTHGHQAQASDLLGLNRSTLRHRLKTLGLAVDKTPTSTADNSPGG
jgi:DNA-binding NtrC family response regulator